jgi:hypothetical protein
MAWQMIHSLYSPNEKGMLHTKNYSTNLFASEANHKKAVFLPEMREKWLFLFQQWAIYST